MSSETSLCHACVDLCEASQSRSATLALHFTFLLVKIPLTQNSDEGITIMQADTTPFGSHFDGIS